MSRNDDYWFQQRYDDAVYAQQQRQLERRLAMRCVLGKRWFGTDHMMGEEPSTRYEERKGRCYELAGYAVVFGTAPAGSILVHGTMHGPYEDNERSGHAWVVLPGGRVWEPTLAEIHATVGDWVGYAAAIAERRYTEREARKLIMATGNWGCWHDTKGRTNNA